MQITIQFETQVKRAAGVSAETVELGDGATIQQSIERVADPSRERLRSFLVGKDGQVLPTVLVFVNDRQVACDDPTPLHDGDTVTIMSPISGG